MALRLLVAKGRAAPIVPVLATHKPASDTIPTAIRDLIRERVAFATSTVEMTETIVGSGSAKRAPAHEVRHDLPGVCFLLAESDREPVRARAYWLDRDQARWVAEATACLRVVISWIGDGFGGGSVVRVIGRYAAAPRSQPVPRADSSTEDGKPSRTMQVD